MRTWNQLSYAVHHKTCKKTPTTPYGTGSIMTCHGHSLARAHSHNSQLAHSQDTIPHGSHSPLVVRNCTIPKRGIHTHNPTPHNPPHMSLGMFPVGSDHPRTCSIIPPLHNTHMPLVFQPYTAILDATYFPLLLDTCDLLRERNSNFAQRWTTWSQAGNHL